MLILEDGHHVTLETNGCPDQVVLIHVGYHVYETTIQQVFGIFQLLLVIPLNHEPNVVAKEIK